MGKDIHQKVMNVESSKSIQSKTTNYNLTANIAGEAGCENVSFRDICAVVVVYFPDDNFMARINRIIEQTGKAVIVVNGYNQNHTELIDRLANYLNVEIILNNNNMGVATALNQGVSWAQKNGFRWALLFDQDTIPFRSMTAELLSVYADFPCKEKVAIVGSNYFNDYNYLPKYRPLKNCMDCKWVQEKTVITSGTLLKLNAFKVIGAFRDDFFIDLVDIEYCLRARTKGYYIVFACKPIMVHRLGNPEEHRLLWRKTGTTNHSAQRRYYMMRNNILTAKKYFLIDPIWVIKSLYSRFKAIILMLLFEQNKLIKFRRTILGLWHGICGK